MNAESVWACLKNEQFNSLHLWEPKRWMMTRCGRLRPRSRKDLEIAGPGTLETVHSLKGKDWCFRCLRLLRREITGD